MGMRKVGQTFTAARADKPRRAVVEAAQQVPSAPPIGETFLKHVERVFVTPPAQGHELRCLAAALGIDWLDVLRELGYWPPLAAAADLPIELEQFCDQRGYDLTRAGQLYILSRNH